MRKNFVAYGRSGNTFTHQVLEEYTGKKRTDLYITSHDKEVKEKKAGCYYCWRNPIDVIYSTWAAEICYKNKKIDFNLLQKDFLEYHINNLKNHYKFYWEHAGLVIQYSRLIKDLEWENILYFFDLKYNKEKIIECSQEMSKQHLAKIIDTQEMNMWMLSDEYNNGRKKFKELYGDYILTSISEYIGCEKEFLLQKIWTL